MNKIFLMSALLVCGDVTAQMTDKACMNYVVYRESSNQDTLTQRSVYDTIMNRVRMDKKTICDVIHEPGQFPYMVNGLKSTPQWWNKHMETIRLMDPVMPDNVYYFNDKQLSFGKFYRKMGSIYFNTRGVKYSINF